MQNETIEALDGVVAWWITSDSTAYSVHVLETILSLLYTRTTQWLDTVFH